MSAAQRPQPRAGVLDIETYVPGKSTAPGVERVFKLWTDPLLVAQWWGIKDCTIPHCVLDVRVGGMTIVIRGQRQPIQP